MISPTITIVVDWTCMLFTFAIFAGRLWVRLTHRNRKRRFAKYDTEIILGLVMVIATAAVCVNTWKNVQLLRLERTTGIDVRSPNVRSESVLTLKLLYAQSFVYFMLVWLIKTAFLSTFWHFAQKITRRCKIALYILTALVAATFIMITLTMFLTCLPIQRAWSLGDDFCSPQQKIWNHSKTAAANIATDLGLIALFIAILRNLSFGTRERWGVIFFLTISTIPILAAILRLIIVALALRPTLKDRTAAEKRKFNDILYLASEIEVTTAFIAACLPAYRGYFKEKKEREQMRCSAQRVQKVKRVTGDEEAWAELDLEMEETSSETGLCAPERQVR